MPRTPIAAQTPAGSYPVLPLAANALDLAFTASDVANGNSVPFGNRPRLLVLVRNAHAADAGTFTIGSAPDQLNRVGDIDDYSLAAGEVGAFIVERAGWRQSDGNLYLNGSAATIMFSIVGL